MKRFKCQVCDEPISKIYPGIVVWNEWNENNDPINPIMVHIDNNGKYFCDDKSRWRYFEMIDVFRKNHPGFFGEKRTKKNIILKFPRHDKDSSAFELNDGLRCPICGERATHFSEIKQKNDEKYDTISITFSCEYHPEHIFKFCFLSGKGYTSLYWESLSE